MKKLRFAVIGCGFWSRFQIGAWTEINEAELVAVYNRTLSRAVITAKEFNVPAIYNNAEDLFRNEKIDFVDIITDVDTHFRFVEMAVKHGVKHIICQKPMAPDLATAIRMVSICRENGAKLYIHENYRWQPQIRRMKEILASGVIGEPFRCNSLWNTAFPVFDTQPFLATLSHFALTDQGSHQFDVLRFLFGEAETIYAKTQRINPKIKGEDVATSFLQMKNGMVCIQQISFSSLLEKEVFPQVLLVVEGDKGSVRLDAGYSFAITAGNKTTYEKVAMKKYTWQTERLEPEPPSIVSCNYDILMDILGKGNAETTGDDNFRTVKLVWAAYESAKTSREITLDDFGE